MASIERRGDSWRVLWRFAGAPQRLTATTLSAAEDVRRQIERADHKVRAIDLRREAYEADHGSIEAALTVAQWVERHVASISTVISAGTLREYENTVRLYLKPYSLGSTPLKAVTRDNIQTWVAELVKKPLKPKSVSNNYVLLASAIRSAVDQQVIPRNPCRGVALPRADAHTDDTAHYLTREQVDTIARSAGRYGPFVVFLARTGLRWGEATALQVGDIDLAAKPPTLRVQRAWNRVPTGRHLGPPKTIRSRRTVTLDDATLAAIGPLLADRKTDAWLFTAPDGRGPLPRQTFREHWIAATKSLGVTVTPHDLRHTHASWLIQAGVPLPVIQRRLGHESITTTVDRYGHLAPDADIAVMAALNGAQ